MKYRPKEAVIEAFQLTTQNRFRHLSWPAWAVKALELNPSAVGALTPVAETMSLWVHTAHGPAVADLGDWIIRGSADLYPCSNEAFMQKYEQVPQPALADCPHAAPHRYCDGCKVTPCPLGLGR